MLENGSLHLNVDSSGPHAIRMRFYSDNGNLTIRSKKLDRHWIPEESVDLLVDYLTEVGFIVQVWEYDFVAIHEHAYIHFDRDEGELADGDISYITEEILNKSMEAIDKASGGLKKLQFKWFTDTHGNYTNIVDQSDEITKDSMYPYIEEGYMNYIRRFIKAKASVLILIGEPGTGKTNFIRNILWEINKKVFLSYSDDVLSSEGVFSSFVSNKDAGSFVIEDADLLLMKRQDGNQLMSKFLNIGDGLLKLHGKKLIFSTNLPTERDIDSAIMRPGRCFDVLNFRRLNLKESNRVCEDYGLPLLEDNKFYTIAEIFNQSKRSEVNNSFGFIKKVV
jgi:SpoVK/Ycf46/Vps4 family AAA+-type ATPase